MIDDRRPRSSCCWRAQPGTSMARASPRQVGEEQTKTLNLSAYAELLRSDVRAQKVAILTEVMGFTEAEDKAFWPIYREYDAEMAKLGDERVALIAEYARVYSDDDRRRRRVARDARRSISRSARHAALKANATTRVGTALSPRTALRVPAGRAPAAADHRPADLGRAADRQVKRRRTVRTLDVRTLVATVVVVVAAGRVALGRSRQAASPARSSRACSSARDSKAVRVLLDDGQVSEVPIDRRGRGRVLGAEAGAAAPPPAPKPPPPAASRSRRRRAEVGDACPPAPPINVRLTQAIDVDASQAGHDASRRIVDDPVMIDGSIVIPRGASAILQAVHVEQSGKMKGSDKITLKLNAIGFGGMVYQVATSYVETKGKGEGKKTGRKVGGGAGLGAIVGGIAGGGEGRRSARPSAA